MPAQQNLGSWCTSLMQATGRMMVRTTACDFRYADEVIGAVADFLGPDLEPGFSLGEFVHAADRTTVRDAVARCEPGESYVVRYRLNSPGGARWVVEEGIVGLNADGERVLTGFVRDGAEAANLEYAVEEQQMALEEALMAHDEAYLELEETRRDLARATLELSEMRRVGAPGQGYGHWVWLRGEQRFQWTDSVYHIWGRDPALGPPGVEEFLASIAPEDREPYKAAAIAAVDGKPLDMEVRIVRPDGEGRRVLARARRVSEAGTTVRLVGTFEDVTDRRALEQNAWGGDRMEAVTRLAGGVAHDFNNVLTVMFSFTEFALNGLPADDSRRADLLEVLKAANRARELTGQLLAFAQRRTVSPVILNVNAVIDSLDRMLRAMMPPEADYFRSLAPDLWNAAIDPEGFEQLMVNLTINARDAMQRGDSFTITTRNRTIYGGDGPLEVVEIEVSDTGSGMAREVADHAFEPFFTTKGTGEGTGLGLSTCFGIVKQAGGTITLRSEEGEGTTVTIQLPRRLGPADALQLPVDDRECFGDETVLVIEDDGQVRHLAVRSLRRYGYTPIEAATPSDAIRFAQSHDGPIDLILTDVVMPQMGGRMLSNRLRQSLPDARVLFMSGYAEDTIVEHGALEPGVRLVAKPFTPEGLAAAVRAALDAEG